MSRAARRCYAHQTFSSDVHDPRALAEILQKAEADLAAKQHPDPYIREFSLDTWSLSSSLAVSSPIYARWHEMVRISLFPVIFQTKPYPQGKECSGKSRVVDRL